MSVTIAQVALDCTNAEKLATFWSQVLDRPIAPGANPYFANLPGAPGQTSLMLLAVPGPKQTKNRLHLDLSASADSDLHSEVERILALGATQVGEHQEHGMHWVCLQDPEGNEFDVAVGH
jgi:hypothetical protein